MFSCSELQENERERISYVENENHIVVNTDVFKV